MIKSESGTRSSPFNKDSVLTDDCSYWAGEDQSDANLVLDLGCEVAIDR